MKSLEEIKLMLARELETHVSQGLSQEQGYYNKSLGDVSFLVASVLGYELKKNNWDKEKWVDDSLITKVENHSDEYKLWGYVIWGREGTTEQWVSPFFFGMKFKKGSVSIDSYKIFFGIKEADDISYEEFIRDRGIFDSGFYTSDNWDIFKRDWDFEINWNRDIRGMEK